MGGKGSGGRRRGAGRKPQTLALALVHASRGLGAKTESEARDVPVTVLASIDPPESLPDDQRAVWVDLACHALALGTLTVDTALAFRDLCEAIVVKRALLAIIQTDGYTISKVTLQMDETGGGLQLVEPKAHPLLPQFRGLMQRVEVGMARFRLTPDGKERTPAAAPPKQLTPLEKLQAQAKQMKRG